MGILEPLARLVAAASAFREQKDVFISHRICEADYAPLEPPHKIQADGSIQSNHEFVQPLYFTRHLPKQLSELPSVGADHNSAAPSRPEHTAALRKHLLHIL